MPAMKVCTQPDCPTLVPRGTTRCTDHEREHDKQRGTRTDRGYGSAHRMLRAQWATRIARTPVACARCHKPINAGMAWDLGHTDDRAGWTGPEHAWCNRSAAGNAR